MPARVIQTVTPLHVRIARAARIAYLRWRISCAQADIMHEESSLWPRQAQIDAWRLDIGEWEVEILTLEAS